MPATNTSSDPSSSRRPSVGAEAIELCTALGAEVSEIEFGEPVTHTYNPLDHARAAVELYMDRFCRSGVDAMLIGMNPGPWGMVQTGVPFGEVETVRDWMGIETSIERPAVEHPKRPVLGFATERSEVSGRRLWGWAADRFDDADDFFDHYFVWNWCPLAFMEESGRNRTPDKLAAHERQPLEAACDAGLQAMVELVTPGMVCGVGAFATKRCSKALGDALPIGTILHPSPASPIANRGWQPQAEAQLEALGLPT